MPPKIMFRVFFGREACALNDNRSGLNIVAPISPHATHHDTALTQDEMTLPPFFGSRLPQAMRDTMRDGRRHAAAAASSVSMRKRARLTVIDGGTTEGSSR